MKNCNEESKCLASLAVFRELYNSEKDIYGIIGEFLKEIISSNGKHQFTINEITQLLNDTYDFKIPEAVVSSSLNRFKDSLEKSYGLFTVTNQTTFNVTGKLTSIHTAIQHNNELIIIELFKFIEEKKKTILSEEEKEEIVNSFCSFIIDESTTQEYSEYVSAFIVKGKKEIPFTTQLNTIREGVVLYTGLKFNSNLSELGSWNTELTIYIETEILFHFAGYNGQIFQNLFDDFFTLVKEINSKSLKKSGKRLIRLKYFSEIKDEIERFFKKAEFIITGHDKANPSKTAMTSIINGCKFPSEIIEKKILFYELLKNNTILEDDYSNYYSEHNFKFNIEDKNLLNKLSEKTGIEDLSNYLKYLNYINIHRKGISDRGFENVGYVLLSGTANTLHLAWDESLKPNGNVPLASNLSFLTNKFWFRLNKSFGKGEFPKSLDIVTKAQIVLSSQLNNSVADKFNELQNKFKKGEFTEEQAVASISELRRQAKKPEEINDYDVGDVLKSIEESSIEQHLKEQELFKDKAKKQKEENVKLKVELNKKDKEIQVKEEEYQDALKLKEKENQEKDLELEKFRENERDKIKRKAKRRKYFKRIGFVLVFLVFIFCGIFLYINYNKALGIITGLFAGILTIAAFFRIDYKTIDSILKKKKK